MKYIVITMLLFVCASSYSQTSIDSIRQTLTPQMAILTPQTQNGFFDFYVHDTASVQNLHIKIGTTDGAGDITEQNLSLNSDVLFLDPESHTLFFRFSSDHYISIYPYVEAWLLFSDGSSSPVLKQHLAY